MLDDEVYGRVIRWVAQRSGLKTIRGQQGGKQPTPPYLMINLTGTDEVRDHPQDEEFIGEDEEDVTAKPVIETEWSFSVHAFGPSPTDILRPLRSMAALPQMEEPLRPNLVIHEVSEIRNVPVFEEAKWEPRAQMDMMLRGLVKDGNLIDVIEEVEPVMWSRN